MNPFDLVGAQFLVFYVLAFGAACALVAWLRHRAARTPMPTRELDPYELAYLRGGAPAAADAVLARLEADGYLKVGAEGSLTLEKNLLRGHDLEMAIANSLKTHARSHDEIEKSARSLTLALKTRLEEEGFLGKKSQPLPLTLAAMAIFGAVGALALVRIANGISRDRPVGFLVVLASASAVVAWCLSRAPLPARTARQLVGSHRRRNAALAEMARVRPAELGGDDAALATALFGVSYVGESGLSKYLRRRAEASGGISTLAAKSRKRRLARASSRKPRAAGHYPVHYAATGAGGCGGGGCGGGGCGGCGG